MNKSIENIDYLVKESLKDFKAEAPSDKGWKRLNKQLIWINFLRFSPYRFNIYYLSTLTIAGILSAFIFGKPVDQIKEKAVTPVQVVKYNEVKTNNATNNNVETKISTTTEKNTNTKNIITQHTKNHSNSTTQKLPDENASTVSTTKLVRDTIVIRKKIVVRDTVKVLMPQKR